MGKKYNNKDDMLLEATITEEHSSYYYSVFAFCQQIHERAKTYSVLVHLSTLFSFTLCYF